jgi:glucose/arabinose dehydrogenase
MKMRMFVTAALALAGLSVLSAARAQAAAPTIALQKLATFSSDPIGIVDSGDGSGRLFIILQRGLIMIYSGGVVLPQPFLDLQARVTCCGEQGLLGLAFHPQYAQNGRFYVNYTDLAGDTVVSRFTVTSNPNVADPGSESLVIGIGQPFSNHNGGQLQFGPDSYLYIGMGDGGSSGDPDNRAQDLGDLLGKMLRLDIDSAQPYAVPPTNPFIGTPGARPEIWAYGLRNPWRFSFDRTRGDLFIADVGQSSWEEVNLQRAASPGGENYGWRLMEGRHCFNPPTDCNDGTLTLPIIEYPHSKNGEFIGCAVIGGYRYGGSSIPSLTGWYLYGDFCTGTIWGARAGTPTTVLLKTALNLSSFGQDVAGELYVCDTATDSLYGIRRGGTPPRAGSTEP